MTTEPSQPLAAPGQDGRHLYTCPLCEAMCGLQIEVADGRVTGIRGNPDDVWSRGHLCPKGVSLGEIHADPDRIRAPMIKVDGQWREVDWDTAFRRCTELLAPVIAEHGIGAVTCYTGNPLAHSFSLGRYTGVLLGMSGIPVSYSPGTVDQWPKNLSSHLMYGNWWGFPVPDIERTELMVILGGMGNLLGAVAGAFAFTAMQEVFGSWTKHWQLLMGCVIVAAVLFLPGGLSAIPGRIKRTLQGDSIHD